MGTPATLEALRQRNEKRKAYRANVKKKLDHERAARGFIKPRSATSLVYDVMKVIGRPVTVQELVVMAWKAHPDVFGLKFFRDIYPDSNLVECTLYGKRGLRRNGWLHKRPDGLWEVNKDRKAADEV